MFLYGYLPYIADDGTEKKVTSPVGGYEIYIRDQVGVFHELAPDQLPADRTSNMNTGDHNSGWHFVKYPIYSDEDAGKREADYNEIRLAEIYYSLAECKFKANDVDGAAKLLNAVRKRNYPQDTWAEYLYKPEGTVTLTQDELYDEWDVNSLPKDAAGLILSAGDCTVRKNGGTRSPMQTHTGISSLSHGI